MNPLRLRRHAFCVAASAFALASCAPSSLPYMQSGAALRALNATGAGKIEHVIFIVQENRSFDNLFQGYPGADTVDEGQDTNGNTIKLKASGLGADYTIDHSAQAMFAACNGTGRLPGTKCRMNGFNHEFTFNAPKSLANPQYVYVPHKDSKPYFDMAHQWVVSDRTFQSQLDESFTAHQYIIAAHAASSVDLPNGAWGCLGGSGDTVATITKNRNPSGPPEQACFDYQTLGDELEKAGLSWRFYASAYGSRASGDGAEWSGFQAVRHIYEGPQWTKNVISPNWKFITDVRQGRLANFTWVTPVCDDSDHVNCPGNYGPSWVSALVNTVGKSKFWNSTAIFVIWDDWGGTYDHVPPPFKDYDGVGFRVPLLVISPYAKANHVSHVPYETTSVLRFAEDLFGLGQLAAADKRAASPAKDCFDFTQPPRKFVPIAAPLLPKFFMHQYRDEANYFAPDYE